jgi:predicted dehydrogenase
MSMSKLIKILCMNNHTVKRILIVGYGNIGKRHSEIIKHLYPEIAIAVLRQSKCKSIKNCFVSIEEAIEFKPNMAIIANPSSLHIDIAMVLAKNSTHLLIEKPISNSTSNIQDLIDICVKNKVELKVAYNLRFLPCLQLFRNLIKQGKVGKVKTIQATVGQYLPDWRPKSDYRESVSAQKKLGGGVLLELSHEIDYIQWIFGTIKCVTAIVSKQSDLDIDVDDTASLLMEIDGPVENKSIIASLNMDFIRHDTTRTCYAIGDKGTLSWDGISGMVQYYPVKGISFEVLYSKKMNFNYTYEKEIQAFIELIARKNNTLQTSGVEGLRVVEVVEAARKSYSEKNFVNIQ